MENHQISEEMQNDSLWDVEDCQDPDAFIENVMSIAVDKNWYSEFNETQLVNIKSDSQYIKYMENFNTNLHKYEKREWDEDDQENAMASKEQFNTIRMIIYRTGPLDWGDNYALVLMVCAGQISRFDPLRAAEMLEVLLRWAKRRQDPIRMHELLTQTLFEVVLRQSLVGKLHFRSDYGDTLEETFCRLQKQSNFFHMAKEQLHETINTILKRLKFRKSELIMNTLLKTWYLYCQQDENDLEFFKNAFFKYCFRFTGKEQSTYSWDSELLKIQEHDPFGIVDFYMHDPLEALRQWVAEDDISANERFHSSLKPFSDPDLIEREFNPTIQNQCIRELCLMAAFDVCDQRTADVFGAIKSLGIGEIFEKMYLEEWCSRHTCYTGPESVRKLALAMKPCNYSPTVALDILHRIRCENPVLTFHTNTPLQATSDDSEQAKNKKKTNRDCETSEGARTLKENFSAKKSKKAGSQDSSNKNTTELDNEAKEQMRKVVALQILYRNLHSVDVQQTSWACLLSVAYQLHPEEKQEILDFIRATYSIEHSELTKCLDAKAGLCLDWGHTLRQHMDVKLSGHELITKTLPAMLGSSVLMFGILEQQGCKILRFLPDALPFKTSDLNLNTGLIDCKADSSLKLIAGIADCSDYMLAEILIKQGFNRRLGFYQGDYYQFVKESGAWDRIEKDQAQSVTREELTVLFSKTLHLIDFQGVVGLYNGSATAMHTMMRKYCDTYQGVGDVLKAAISKIRFEPPKELPYLACFRNGMVDLRTKERLGPADPSDYVLQSIPYPYDPDADQSMVKEHISSMFPTTVYDDAIELRDFYQIHSGSFLTRANVMPAALLLVGEGSNGKSRLCEILRKGLGKYHATMGAEALEKDPGENNDNLFRARFARCATIMEVEKGKKLSTKMIKTLTGGDVTELNAKYKSGLEVETTFTMHIFANDVPDFTVKISNDFALARRIAVIPMRVQFLDDNDTTQREKLKSAGHEHWAFPKNEALVTQLINDGIPGLLAFLVDGAQMLFAKDCKLVLPPTIWNATNQEKGEDVDELIRDFVGTQLIRAAGCIEKTFISTEEMTVVYRTLHGKESCLLKSGPFASTLKAVIGDVFIKQQVEGRDVIVTCNKKKGAPSPLGPKELRGYFNLVWKPDSDGEVEAAKFRKTFAE